MSELEAKRSEAKAAISKLLRNTTQEDNYTTVHEVNVLVLGLADAFLANNANLTVMNLTQGRGKPKLQQRYYSIKISDLRIVMGDILDDVTPVEEKITVEELPSYLIEEGDDE